MNYLAHGIGGADRPYYLAGTAVPDWLNVIARRVRIRRARAERYTDDARSEVAQLAAGIVAHHRDDEQFHRAAVFQQLSWELTARVRDAVDSDPGMRPAFVGHILVELLLDAHLAVQRPEGLDRYYAALGTLDPQQLERTIETVARAPLPGCAPFFQRFLREKFLYDYADDGKLLVRLNQVMRRVGLALLPQKLAVILPEARRRVGERAGELVGFEPRLAAWCDPVRRAGRPEDG